MSFSEVSAILVKLSEVVSRQSEEIELIRADLHILANSSSTNVAKLRERIDRAEKAITEEHPKVVSERFESIEGKLEEMFHRFNQTGSRLSEISRRLEELKERESSEEKYGEATRKLAGVGRLINPSILSYLERP
ncbi:MAG: hypothetical protein V1820_06060 [archaeon]